MSLPCCWGGIPFLRSDYLKVHLAHVRPKNVHCRTLGYETMFTILLSNEITVLLRRYSFFNVGPLDTGLHMVFTETRVWFLIFLIHAHISYVIEHLCVYFIDNILVSCWMSHLSVTLLTSSRASRPILDILPAATASCYNGKIWTGLPDVVKLMFTNFSREKPK